LNGTRAPTQKQITRARSSPLRSPQNINTRLKSKGRALFYHTRQAFSDQWLALLAAEDFGKFRHVGNDVIDAILIQGMRI
jgi:hypothetical protein